jgi:hypothetical protein
MRTFRDRPPNVFSRIGQDVVMQAKRLHYISIALKLKGPIFANSVTWCMSMTYSV